VVPEPKPPAKRSWKDLLRGTFPPSKARLNAEARYERPDPLGGFPALTPEGMITELRAELREQRRQDLRHRFRSNEKRADLAALQRECENLQLFVAAILRLLIARNLATESEVLDLVDAIDAEDGALDGKNASALPKRKPRKHAE
jgi:hypothetical protein